MRKKICNQSDAGQMRKSGMTSGIQLKKKKWRKKNADRRKHRTLLMHMSQICLTFPCTNPDINKWTTVIARNLLNIQVSTDNCR